jgi:hypothetical protein
MILFFNFETKGQGIKAKYDTLSKTVLIHPVIKTGENEILLSFGHEYKDHLELGDQLAHDYVVVLDNGEGEAIEYQNEGKENKDYISWRKKVMAPVTGTVILINHPTETNKPGVMNRDAEPGRIYIKNDRGIIVSLVHVCEINVKKGQQVKAGDVVARVGNNGNSTGPHIHVGAWKNGKPYQPVIDLYAEQRYGH